jgi:hypothetical protein
MLAIVKSYRYLCLSLLVLGCSNFQFTKLDAMLYNNKLMVIQQNCDSAKLNLKSAINSMNKDSIIRTYDRFKLVIADQHLAWQNIKPEKNDDGLYIASGATVMMYQRNISVYYNDVISFYTHTLPTHITEKSIEIRGKQQMAQVTEEGSFQYLLKKQEAFIKRYKILEK